MMALDNSPQVILRQQQSRRRSRPLSQVLMGCINKDNYSGVVRWSSKRDILDPEWQFVKQYPPDYNVQKVQTEEAPSRTSSISFATAGFNMMKQRSKSLYNIFTNKKHVGSKCTKRSKKGEVYDNNVRLQYVADIEVNKLRHRSPLSTEISVVLHESQNSSVRSSSSSSTASSDKLNYESRPLMKFNYSSSSDKFDIPFMDGSPRMWKRNYKAASREMPLESGFNNRLIRRHELPLCTSTPKKGSVNGSLLTTFSSRLISSPTNQNLKPEIRPRSKSYTRFESNSHQPLPDVNQSIYKQQCPNVKTQLNPSDFYGIHCKKFENNANNKIYESSAKNDFLTYINSPTFDYVSVPRNSCDNNISLKRADNLVHASIPESFLSSKQRNHKNKPIPPERRDSLSTRHGEPRLQRRNGPSNKKPRPMSCGDILSGQKHIVMNGGNLKDTVDVMRGTSDVWCSNYIQDSQENSSHVRTNVRLPIVLPDIIAHRASCTSLKSLITDRLQVHRSSIAIEHLTEAEHHFNSISLSPTRKEESSNYISSALVTRVPTQNSSVVKRTFIVAGEDSVTEKKSNSSKFQESNLSNDKSHRLFVSYLNDENLIPTCHNDDFCSGSIYRRGARRWRKHYKINGHIFQPKRFNRRASCAFCKDRIWGLGRQGFKCTQCKMLVHKKCSKLQHIVCNGELNTSSDTLTSHESSRGGSNGGLYLPNEYAQEIPDPGTTEEISVETPSDLQVSSANSDAMTSGNSDASQYGLNDFELVRVIGRGSYAKVLMVELKRTKRIYAMKVIKKTLVADDEDIDWVQTEKHVFETASNHPFLVGLHSCFQTPSRLFFVIEFVRGGDLMFHMQRQRRLPEEHARFYAAEICLALNFLHEKGIIYRDLKLDNVLLDHEGHIKLTDYGMCKEGIRPKDTTSTFCGTPNYIAPEILQGEDYSFSVDWWALGVLLYEMLAGKSPFDIVGASENPDCNTEDFLFQVILERPIRIPRSLSVKAASILKGFLNKNPVDRLGCHLETGFTDLIAHMFFKSIDWEMLMQKQITPPYRPRLDNEKDYDHFDPQFTNEPANLTPDDPNEIENLDQTEFDGFEYVNPLLMSMEDCV